MNSKLATSKSYIYGHIISSNLTRHNSLAYMLGYQVYKAILHLPLLHTGVRVRVSLVPRPSARGRGGRPGTHCVRMRLISRNSRNSVARADFSVLLSSRPYIIQRYVFRNLPVSIYIDGRWAPPCGRYVLQCLQCSSL